MEKTPTIFPFSNHLGMYLVKRETGKSHFQLPIKDFHFNPQKVIHGGVLYSLADTGMGGALYPMLALDKGELCATIEIKMTYLKAARTGVLDCHTVVINKGKRVAMLESEIWNEGKLIAKATGSYAVFTPSKS
ncbi:MAG: PaaI family thioesterase [Saprospiraceae bacterium]